MFIKSKQILITHWFLKKKNKTPKNNQTKKKKTTQKKKIRRKKKRERSSEQTKSSIASWGLKLSRSPVQVVIKLKAPSTAEERKPLS